MRLRNDFGILLPQLPSPQLFFRGVNKPRFVLSRASRQWKARAVQGYLHGVVGLPQTAAVAPSTGRAEKSEGGAAPKGGPNPRNSGNGVSLSPAAATGAGAADVVPPCGCRSASRTCRTTRQSVPRPPIRTCRPYGLLYRSCCSSPALAASVLDGVDGERIALELGLLVAQRGHE